MFKKNEVNITLKQITGKQCNCFALSKLLFEIRNSEIDYIENL